MTKEHASQDTPPLFFRDILGQERVLTYLKTALRRGRLAHAYLFLGPEGVGKESVARALAGALNCAEPLEGGDACGVCPSCKRLAAGTHPDYVVIRPTSAERPPKIKIDQVRDFRRLTAYPPLGGGWRVALIKPGEDMRDETTNALLKTLEEPPPQHLLILTAGVEADLFPTVVSRCQKMSFPPLPSGLVAQELQKRRGLTEPQARLLAALSGGSLGRALAMDPEELLDQRERVLGDLERLSQGNATTALDWARGLAKAVPETNIFLLMAQLWYRDLLLSHFQAPAALLAHQDCLPELKQEQAAGHPEAWFGKFAALGAAHRHLQANLNPELTLDILGLRLKDRGYDHDAD